MSTTTMTPAQVQAELDEIRARRRELAPTGTSTAEQAAAMTLARMREHAQLCQREAAAWDALDLTGIDDPAVLTLLIYGAGAGAMWASQRADEWNEDVRSAERRASMRTTS